jgi:hypothetical protein
MATLRKKLRKNTIHKARKGRRKNTRNTKKRQRIKKSRRVGRKSRFRKKTRRNMRGGGEKNFAEAVIEVRKAAKAADEAAAVTAQRRRLEAAALLAEEDAKTKFITAKTDLEQLVKDIKGKGELKQALETKHDNQTVEYVVYGLNPGVYDPHAFSYNDLKEYFEKLHMEAVGIKSESAGFWERAKKSNPATSSSALP